jgi:hypothetical protein
MSWGGRFFQPPASHLINMSLVMKNKSKELEMLRDLKRRVLLEFASDDGLGILAAEFYFDVGSSSERGA